MKTSEAWMIAAAIMVFVLSGCQGTEDVSNPGGMIAGMMRDELHPDASSPPTEIDLSTVANIYALANAGSPVLGGGIDGLGYAYAENLSGPSISWSGATFTLGTAGIKNGVRQTTITLPAGNYSSLMLLATGANGNQPNQTFLVNYTDGTHTSFVQSLSDWYTPQNYAGESKAFSFAYRVNSTGGTGTGPFYLYGYSFALDASKTVQNLTLPNNAYIVVLAINLIPAGTLPTAATPTMSPAQGTYSTAQSVTLSDTTPGATIYYTTNGTTPTTSSAKYSSPIPVAATTTIEAIAVASGYTNSAVATSTYTITSAPVSVGLSAAANIYALANAGSPVLGGGIDGLGYAYAENLSGPSISWSGATFTLGTAGIKNGVRQTTVTLPAGNYSRLMLLATGANGNQPNQTFLVNYTDGTHTSFAQSLSDWYTPQNYAGESIAFTFHYRLTAAGATDARTFYLYGYTLALNSAKTLQSIALPNNTNIVVVAIDLIPAGTQPKAATPTMRPPPGTYNTAQSVALSDSTPGAAIYYTTNGTTPTTSSAKYSSPIPVAATTTIEAIAVASGYTNSDVTIGTYTITPPSAPVPVSLSTVANVYALAKAGSPVLGGGIDGYGNAYAENLTGASITWNGATFALGTAGIKNGVRQTTVTLPAGRYSSLMLLAAGARGNQPSQTFVVNYADGTHTDFVQGLSDWYTPQNYAGESIAFTFPYRLTATGATDARTFYLYGYTLALNSAKTLQSIALPNNTNIVVVGIDLIPASGGTITGVTFDWTSHRTSDFAAVAAQGSDNWSTTWSNDDNQYAIWGDGGGFGGTDTDWRSSLGVARIVADSDNYQGFNRYGGKAGECSPTTFDNTSQKYISHTIDGKSHGAPLSLGGVLYAWITPKSGVSGYQSFTLYRSTDKACTWTKLGVSFDLATYGISFGSFVQFGKDNGSAIDAYVYTVATAVSDVSSLSIVQRPGSVMLLRVPAASIETGPYEFFAGLDPTSGQPTWSPNRSLAQPIYQNGDRGVGPFAQMSYVPDLGRFVYTNQHGTGLPNDNSGGQSLLTMAEAPLPWGPWTDFYSDLFGSGQIETSLFQWSFAPKWFRNGGRSFTLIFSGTGSNDSWNTVDGAFTISP